MKSEFKFGDKVKDRVTGFTGVITALAFYSTGCNQALVQPKIKDKKTLTGASWMDFERLKLIKRGAVKIPTSPTGGPRHNEAAPTR